ncbi:MAG: GxxExxY protein [Desulforhabdus sp.]|jgi:GxxExxY protein|nr:GxxExxY protein [Desulforhabdus sp.]
MLSWKNVSPSGRIGDAFFTTKSTKVTKGMRIEFDELSKRAIGCAIEVHKSLGPGLLESAYEQCLAHELAINGLAFKLQWPLAEEYKGIRIDCAYRVDVLVEDQLILELKSVDQLPRFIRHSCSHI